MKKILILFISALITLVICLLVNSQQFSPKVEQDITSETFWTNKAHQTNKFEAVIMGDSRALRGINPAFLSIFENTFNFAFRSATFTSDYLSNAHKLLKTNGTVIIAVTPHSFLSNSSPNEHFYEYKNISIDNVFIKKNKFIHKLFSSFKERKFDMRRIPSFNKNFNQNGFVATDRESNHFQEGLDVYEARFSSNQFDLGLFKKFLKVAKKSKFQYIFFRMPSSKGMENLENKKSGYSDKLTKRLVEESGFQWIDFKERFSFSTYDASHLRPESATKFSKILNKVLFGELKSSHL
jgi:hypothetical protein